MKDSAKKPAAHLVIFMLILVYLSWGSIYIGNKLSLEVAGPFLVCGMRNALGGLLTLAVCPFIRGQWRRPTAGELVHFSGLAFLLVTLASGFLVLGQTQVSSGVAAIVMSSTPIFMLIGAFLFGGEAAPNRMQCIGMFTGACAISYLSWSEQSSGAATPLGVVMILGAIAGWVTGSLLMKKSDSGATMSTMESTGFILLLGGLECLLIGLALGEAGSIRPENIRFDTVVGFGWMVVGGSFIAYATYLWLLANVSVSLAVSYEYVVPVIGIFLGWLIGGETVTGSMVCACAVSVGSVFLVVRHRHSFKSYVRHYLMHRNAARRK